MDLETEHSICSLCKRELASFSLQDGPGARLCENCRGLVQTAFRGAEPRAVPSLALAQRTAATSVQSDPSTIGRVETASPDCLDDVSTFAYATEETQEFALANLYDESLEMSFEDKPSAPANSEAKSVDLPLVESTQPPDEALVAVASSNDSVHAEMSELHLSLSDDRSPDESSLTPNMPEHAELLDQALDQTEEQTQSISGAAAGDPWEDPLPAWDYSRSEWPVLMGPSRGRSFARFKVPFAVLMILGLGAAFYYLIYPQISRDQPLPTDAVLPARTPEPRAGAQETGNSSAQSQASTPPSASTAGAERQPAQPPARDAGVANEISNTQGHFALQVAAFPTQAGADDFAERLKTAGVPSYVVSANLARRGRWFRVRVGRFNTAEDAQKFANEAQLRAKAAGMSLQLIVSQYEQP
jgi:cell division septation protein DedD